MPAGDIQKISKEEKSATDIQKAYTREELTGGRGRHHDHSGPKGYKDKGGFFEAQFSAVYVSTCIDTAHT